MSLIGLEIDHLRCLQRAELELHPGTNLMVGPNGSGKTSLLEAIYLLGRGRSFRTRHTERLIAHGADRLLVLGRLPAQSVIGVSCDRLQGLEARIDRRAPRTLAELSEALPVQVLDPGIHRLVEEGPLHRRRWLDWGVFHVEPQFVGQWTAYTRALRQRNAALKGAQDPSPWDRELAPLGEHLSVARERVAAAVEPIWLQTLQSLAGPADVTLNYHRGWSQEHSLQESLAGHLARDRERGTTAFGAHRFDVVLKQGGRVARETLSRGQQKLVGAALALAMARLVGQYAPRPPMLLLDDPAAELDVVHTEALMSEIRNVKGQMVVTALSATEAQLGTPDRVFHVEQGRVQQL